MLVAVQLSVLGLYLPPVFKSGCRYYPPQTIISTASPHCRVTIGPAGALVVLVAVQLSVLGLYFPPVFKSMIRSFHPRRSFHCQSTLRCDRIGQRARWWCWWLSNYPCWDCICHRCSNSCRRYRLRPRRSFRCQSTLRCERIAAEGALVVLVAVHVSSMHPLGASDISGKRVASRRAVPICFSALACAVFQLASRVRVRVSLQQTLRQQRVWPDTPR